MYVTLATRRRRRRRRASAGGQRRDTYVRVYARVCTHVSVCACDGPCDESPLVDRQCVRLCVGVCVRVRVRRLPLQYNRVVYGRQCPTVRVSVTYRRVAILLFRWSPPPPPPPADLSCSGASGETEPFKTMATNRRPPPPPALNANNDRDTVVKNIGE